jgi:hypothetical protein
MSLEELQSGFVDLARKLYSTEETTERRRKFKAMLKESPHSGFASRYALAA